jgi:hypothetical protein
MTNWREERRQIATIARATFGGFLQSDLMPAGMQAQSAIWAAAFLAAPALLPCAQDLVKYNFIRRYQPTLVESSLWNDQALFILLSAGAIGIVSVVMWDTLFPGRRDVFVLGPLPVATRVQSAGRLGGLLTLFILFALALNVLPTLLFPVVSSGSVLAIVRNTAAHFTTTLAADAFVFFGMTVAQGTLIVLTTRRAAERLAPVIQTCTVLALLLALLFLTPLREATRDALERGDLSDPILRWFPLAWFVGLYGVIAGTSRPIMQTLALRGLLAGTLPLAATVALYLCAYRWLCARAIESPARSTTSSISRAASALMKTLLVRKPAEQAVCSFTLRVLARSRRHRMLLSIYIGGALALICAALLPEIAGFRTERFAHPSVATLAAPLILSVGLGVGFRVLLAIPVDLPARWIFELVHLMPLRVAGGVHKAGLVVVLLPVAVTAWLSAVLLWGPSIAWRHVLFCTVLATLLLELLLVNYRGVPFSRVYVPGGSRFHLLWPLYLTCFITYTYSAAAVEREMLANHDISGVLIVFSILAMIVTVIRLWGVSRASPLSFAVEIPDATFAGFNLSEGLAAQAVGRHEPMAAPRID